jgi:hypothetical protein
MQKRNILGVTSRYVIVLNQQGVAWCSVRPIQDTRTDDEPWPVKHSEDNEQRQNDFYEIALPEKRHLIWNQISY